MEGTRGRRGRRGGRGRLRGRGVGRPLGNRRSTQSAQSVQPPVGSRTRGRAAAEADNMEQSEDSN